MKKSKEELLEDFRLDYMDVEYEMENHLGRAMKEKETNNLFMNFLRRKMGLSFIFNNKLGKPAVFTDSASNEIVRKKTSAAKNKAKKSIKKKKIKSVKKTSR